MSTSQIILVSLFGLIVKFAYLFAPADRFWNPYPATKWQKISVQSWMDYPLSMLFTLLLFVVVYRLKPVVEVKWLCWLWGLFIVDYFITYNQPLWYFKDGKLLRNSAEVEASIHWPYIPVSYALVAGIIMITLLVTRLFK